MRFRRGTCGLCKPTKRYKTNATRRSQARRIRKAKNDVLVEVPGEVTPSVGLLEIKR